MAEINIFLGFILLIVSKKVKKRIEIRYQDFSDFRHSKKHFFIILTNLFVLAKCGQGLHICIPDNAKINRVIAAIIPHLGRPRCASVYLPTSTHLYNFD